MKACNADSIKLSAFADGQLSKWAAWRLRRHIRACGHCAREFAGHQRLNVALRAVDVVPEDGRTTHVSPTNERMVRTNYLLAGAGVAAAILGGIFYAAPTRPISGLAAQAAVADAMSQVRTAQWRQTDYAYDKEGKKTITSISEYSARLDPPTLIRRRTPIHGKPSDYGGFEIMRSDAREMEIYDNGSKPGILGIFRDPKIRFDLGPEVVKGEGANQRMRRTVIDSMFASLNAEKQRKAKPYYHPNGYPELVPVEPTLRRITQNGREFVEIREGNEFPGSDNDTGWYRIIRADAFTRRVVEIDTKVVRLSTKQIIRGSHSDDYMYDRTLPAGVFDLNVASGSYIRLDGKWIISPWDKLMHPHNLHPHRNTSTRGPGPTAPR